MDINIELLCNDMKEVELMIAHLMREQGTALLNMADIETATKWKSYENKELRTEGMRGAWTNQQLLDNEVFQSNLRLKMRLDSDLAKKQAELAYMKRKLRYAMEVLNTVSCVNGELIIN